MAVKSRKPCFVRVGWQAGGAKLFVWFSNGSRYRYDAATLADYLGMQAAVAHGRYYDFNVRGLRDRAVRIDRWPSDFTLSFNGGA